MDKNLLIKNHIFNINKKSSYNLFLMGKIHRYLSINTTQEIGLALVMSNMDYCNGVLYGSHNSVLQPLQITQNRCAKMVLYKDKYSISTDARYTLHWLPIKDRILYKILCLDFKCVHGLGPSYLNGMFVQNVPQRRLRSNSTNEITYIVPRNKNKTFGDRSFSFVGPYERNNLPNELKCIENYATFKKYLKTFFYYYLRFLCYRIINFFSLNDKLSLPTGQLHQVLWKIFS